MKLHWDAAPAGLAKLLRSLSQTLAGTDFYVAGGTALALLEGHRVSADIDLFSASFEHPDELLATIEREHPTAQVALVAPRTLYLRIDDTVVSFFGYRYPLVAPQLRPEADLLSFASREDIAAMKLAAIASRGSRKDFIDLWWIVKRHWTLGECLDFFRTKFATRDIGHVVRSLVFFDDADGEPPLRLLDAIDWDTVKRDLRARVTALMESDQR